MHLPRRCFRGDTYNLTLLSLEDTPDGFCEKLKEMLILLCQIVISHRLPWNIIPWSHSSLHSPVALWFWKTGKKELHRISVFIWACKRVYDLCSLEEKIIQGWSQEHRCVGRWSRVCWLGKKNRCTGVFKKSDDWIETWQQMGRVGQMNRTGAGVMTYNLQDMLVSTKLKPLRENRTIPKFLMSFQYSIFNSWSSQGSLITQFLYPSQRNVVYVIMSSTLVENKKDLQSCIKQHLYHIA